LTTAPVTAEAATKLSTTTNVQRTILRVDVRRETERCFGVQAVACSAGQSVAVAVGKFSALRGGARVTSVCRRVGRPRENARVREKNG